MQLICQGDLAKFSQNRSNGCNKTTAMLLQKRWSTKQLAITSTQSTCTLYSRRSFTCRLVLSDSVTGSALVLWSVCMKCIRPKNKCTNNSARSTWQLLNLTKHQTTEANCTYQLLSRCKTINHRSKLFSKLSDVVFRIRGACQIRRGARSTWQLNYRSKRTSYQKKKYLNQFQFL